MNNSSVRRGGGMSGYEDVIYDVRDGVATLTINRPEVHNAFRLRTLDELRMCVELADNDPDVGVLVITGAGNKAFSSGGDIRMEAASDRRSARLLAQRCMALSLAIRTAGIPIVARVNGWCVGG